MTKTSRRSCTHRRCRHGRLSREREVGGHLGIHSTPPPSQVLAANLNDTPDSPLKCIPRLRRPGAWHLSPFSLFPPHSSKPAPSLTPCCCGGFLVLSVAGPAPFLSGPQCAALTNFLKHRWRHFPPPMRPLPSPQCFLLKPDLLADTDGSITRLRVHFQSTRVV